MKAVRSEVSSSVLYDPLLEKFINNLMKRGDKKKADVLVKQALFHIKFIKPPQFEHPLAVLEAAIKNATPCLQLTDIRRGGITYEVRSIVVNILIKISSYNESSMFLNITGSRTCKSGARPSDRYEVAV